MGSESGRIHAEKLRELLLYDRETGLFQWRIKGVGLSHKKPVGSKDYHGYISIRVLGKLYPAHNLAWLYVHGRWPSPQLDHINRIKDDNRLSNLRELSQKLNGYNRGAKGIHFDKQIRRWRAYLGGKYLGVYKTEQEASTVRQKALESLAWPRLQESDD